MASPNTLKIQKLPDGYSRERMVNPKPPSPRREDRANRPRHKIRTAKKRQYGLGQAGRSARTDTAISRSIGENPSAVNKRNSRKREAEAARLSRNDS